jgi:putative hydrolase of the HAD superfamily
MARAYTSSSNFKRTGPGVSGRGLCRPSPLGVVTNGDADQQRRKLRRVGLAVLLQHVAASSEAGAAKPDAGICAAACSELGIHPSRAVFVGDRLQIDAEAAVAAGLNGIWLDRRDAAHVTTAVPRIRTLTELPPLLARLRSALD